MTNRVCDVTLALLASRPQDATVCQSEVARAITPGENWRDAMPAVHSAVDRLFDEGIVRLSWKGKPLATCAGPYRISRAGHG
jgi:hypothetical protein